MAAVVAGARFVYLAGGSPLHLGPVKKSATFEACARPGPAGPSWPAPGPAPWC